MRDVHSTKRKTWKKKLLKKQDYKCILCGDEFYIMGEATFDHIIPKSKGGRSDFINLQLACKFCNGTKGSK